MFSSDFCGTYAMPGLGCRERIGLKEHAFLPVPHDHRLDLGEREAEHLQTKRQQHRPAVLFDDGMRARDAFADVEKILPIRTECGHRFPETLAQFHLDRVFGEPQAAADLKSFWIVSDHRIQIRGNEIAEALSITPLRRRRGRVRDDEHDGESNDRSRMEFVRILIWDSFQ